MTSTLAAPAVALYCDQCEQPAVQEIDWVELTDTLDQRGNTTTVCDSHICWAAAIEVIEDEFGGKVQQTRRTTPPVTGAHRRNHDLPARTVTSGAYRAGTGEIVQHTTVLVHCHDCGREYVEGDNEWWPGKTVCIPNSRRMLGLAAQAAS